MALHGRIELNGGAIGYWSATRLTGLTQGTDGIYRYECALVLDRKMSSGIVEHRYSDGAPVLISKLMAQLGRNPGG